MALTDPAIAMFIISGAIGLRFEEAMWVECGKMPTMRSSESSPTKLSRIPGS